jgi:hypothetical protein
MKRMPLILTVTYLMIFTSVLVRYACWPIGDQTDVVKVGIASFPIGLLLSFVYPGGRTGAFAAVSLAALLNAMAIYYLTRKFIRQSPR